MSQWSKLLIILLAISLNQDGPQRHASGSDELRCFPNRLLNNVSPLEYDIKLSVDQERGLTYGTVDIYVAITRREERSLLATSNRLRKLGCHEQNTIVLNLEASLKLDKARVAIGNSVERLRQGRGRSLKVEGDDWNRKMSLVALRIAPGLDQGSFGLISLEFAPEHQRDLEQDHSKLRKSAIVFGKFLTSKLHHSFPCFDAPRFRSKFSLTIETDEQSSVYSNMPLAKQWQLMKNKRQTSFEQSPEIPVHKLVFSVGNYKAEKPKELLAGIPALRLVSQSEQELNQAGQFALEVAAKALQWLTGKLAKQLPIEKLDIIACDEVNFNSSSHLGAILIEKNFLLINPKESSPERKILVALNVAQAVAQQWFGNLLSPSRWVDNWLTLGLAGLLAIELLDELYPGLGARHYVRSHMLPMEMRLRATRAVRQRLQFMQTGPSVLSQVEQSSLVDLEWVRGASIMSMTQNLIGGREQFFKALRLLLAYDSTGLITQDKLTDCLAKVSKGRTQTQLDTFLDRWREHGSYPLLKVLIDPRSGTSETSSVLIYQGRIEHVKSLELDRVKPVSHQDAIHMQLKLMFSNLDGSRREFVELPLDAFSGRPTPTVPMHGLVKVAPPDWFDLSSATSGDWLKLVIEPNVLPYHRVRYAQDLVERMKLPIQSGTMSSEDQIDLLNDASSLIRVSNNILPGELVTDVVSWISLDQPDSQLRSSAVLNELLQAKQSKLEMIPSNGFIGSWDTQLRELPICRRVFREFGFSQARPNESVFEQFVRSSALIDLINDDVEQVVEAALKLANEPVEAFLRAPIYAAISRAGSEEQRAKLIGLVNETNWPEETERLRLAINQIRAPNIAESLNSWSNLFKSLLRKTN